MGSRDLVNKFTAGELDPKFIAEVDFDGYRKAGRKLRNVLTVPQGGVQRRFGTTYQATIMDGANKVSNPEQVRLISYEAITGQLYYIVIRPNTATPTQPIAFDIYRDGGILTTVLCPISTYTVADIRNIRWVKTYDTLVLLLGTLRPYELRRIADANWTIAPITFQFFPTWDYSGQDNPSTLPTPGVPYTSPTVTFTPNLADATTLTASTAVFTSNHVNGLYFGNEGTFRITAVNGAGTVATGYCLVEFADTTAIRGDLSGLFERVWNDGQAIGSGPVGISRGWPSHGCLYQSRLMLGGNPSLPGAVFGSNTKAYFDFDDSSKDPTSTFGVELSVTGTDVLTDVIGSKSLVLVGNKGPGSTTILLNEPTTPTNAFLNTQGTEGSRNMNAIIIDNQILYADRAGNTIWGMTYDIPDTGYTINNISILSTHLIRGPRWADIFDPDDVDGRYYLLINSDGTLAIYTTLLNENIRAWTLANTTGAFVDVECVSNECKFLVRRKIGTTGVAIDGDPDAVYTAESTFNALPNVTPFIIDESGTPVFINDNDYLLIGSEIPFNQIQVLLDVNADESINASYEFLNDTGEWETFTPVTDGTNDFQNSGAIEWTHDLVSNWKAQIIAATDTSYNELAVLYWMRIRRNNDNFITNPVVHTLFLDTQNVIYLEEADFGVYMDSQVDTISDADGNITGLTTLGGQNVFVFANDFPIGSFYVNSDGTFNTPYADAFITAGLDYKPYVITMPLVVLMQNGYSVYEPAHVKHAYVDYYQSNGLVLNGQNFPQVVPGNFMSQELPAMQTGFYKFPMYGGWDPRFEFVITQSYPAPMNILAISYTIEVNP